MFLSSCFPRFKPALAALVMLLVALPAQAQATALITELFTAIHHTQVDQPESYFWADGPSSRAEQAGEPAVGQFKDACNAPLGGQVHGSALYRGLPFDYSIDFDIGQLQLVYGGQSWSLSREALLEEQGLAYIFPCVTPVTALICLSGFAGAGGYCIHRVRTCEAATRHCQCGVQFVDCGSCGEGRGVQCAPCPDLRDPRDYFWSWGR